MSSVEFPGRFPTGKIDLSTTATLKKYSFSARASPDLYRVAAMLGMNPTALNFRIQGKRSFEVTEPLKIAWSLDITLAHLMGDELLNENPRQVGGGTMIVAASAGISGLGSHDDESCGLTGISRCHRLSP